MMNESLNTSDELAKSYSEYDCEADEVFVYENIEKPKCTNPVIQMANEILLDRAKYNKSYAASSDYADNLNKVPGAKLKLPTTKIGLKREAILKYSYEHHVFCASCKCLVKNGDSCAYCGKVTKKTKNNYFIYIPLLQQIEHMLDKYIDIIVQNFENRETSSGEITDFYDAKIFKNVQDKYENKVLLPFTICTDGVRIFNFAKGSLWPIQLIQCYLPPNIRYLKENVLIAGLYCGQEKPDVSVIMVPLAQELAILKQRGIFTYRDNKLIEFSPTVMYCASDLPARADLQNCKPSGYNSCPCCKQNGTLKKNVLTGKSYVRFLKTEDPPQRRTHQDAIQVGYDILKGKNITDAKGLKGLSCMVAFKDFDLSNGFVLDYMHGVTIGIVPLLLDIWLGKKRLAYEEEIYGFKAMCVKQRLELNRRILALKPVMRIRHKPRSILERAFFTANEYRSLLLYYLRFALSGLIDRKLLKHFLLLSEATYTLSKSRITPNEIHTANAKLQRFADEFEYYYGKNSITINTHLLRHYAESVLNTGPLWCHSMFCFESNNGEIKKSFNCTVDIVEQIAHNYSIKAAFSFVNEADSSTQQSSKEPRILRIKPKNIEQERWNKNLGLTNKQHNIGFTMSWKNQVFKSTASAITKSIDYFVQLNDGSLGTIEVFVQLEKPYVVIRNYEIVKEFHHHKQVKESNRYRMYPYNEIREKLIYLRYSYSNVSFMEVVTLEPNRFEGC